ncbi:MazG-like family protein [Capillibacterium thermochitinicola]|uniref:MazG-like family protein n=1 Tax=Capillibacterium thermochitinicola TaxID=2699427 RepID=A0A8J6LIJ6_9FIRM|nr:MazG-like family protein [Capillibacterium thermochitinicola]MBA2133085.1 MazG-like family protein [Capillibacterium thermochitinicola]
MTRPQQEVDIARKLHTIEWLKSELLEGVSLFFKALLGNNRQVITKALATIILTCYFLGRRLGIGLQQVDQAIEEQLRHHLAEEHQLEDWYGDLSACLNYLQGKKRG